MSNTSFEYSNLIHIYGATPSIQRYTIPHDLFLRFSRSLSLLEQALGEAKSDEYWEDILFWFKRYRFNVTASPLPFNWQVKEMGFSVPRITERISRCKHVYPAHVDAVDGVFKLWSDVSTLNEHPYLPVMGEFFLSRRIGNILLVVRESRLVAPLSDYLKQNWEKTLGRGNVVAVNQIDHLNVADEIIIFGPARWFPAYLFNAPRSPKTRVISFVWIDDRIDFEPSFPGITDLPWKPICEDNDVQFEKTYNPTGTVADSIMPMLTAEEFIFTINWHSLSRRLLNSIDDDSEYRETTEANLLVLVSDKAVFVEASDTATTLVIDPDDDDDLDGSEQPFDRGRVSRRKSAQLKPGDFVLLRTEGSGDYVVPIANRLMGEELAIKARESQLNWKFELRRHVNRKGLLESCIELIDLGSARANETNLRNWMSVRSIRPDDIADFHAIMRFIDRSKDFDTTHDYSEKIMSAHRRAGQLIRRQLLSEVRKSDLRKLRRDGIMEFSLQEADGGSLTAFRIETVEPRKFEVATIKLDQLISLEEILWLE